MRGWLLLLLSCGAHATVSYYNITTGTCCQGLRFEPGAIMWFCTAEPLPLTPMTNSFPLILPPLLTLTLPTTLCETSSPPLNVT